MYLFNKQVYKPLSLPQAVSFLKSNVRLFFATGLLFDSFRQIASKRVVTITAERLPCFLAFRHQLNIKLFDSS